MARRRSSQEPNPVEPKSFSSVQEIDTGIRKLERRLSDLEGLDLRAAVLEDTGRDDAVESDIRETIREVFGTNSPEFREHEHLRIWAGPSYINAYDEQIIEAKERGRSQARGTLQGLVARVKEKREDLLAATSSTPSSYFHQLNLHPRIADVANDLFMDGYHWEAVFAAAKSLINYVKEKSGRDDLDGAPLMRTVFSRANSALAFNEATNPTDGDEQEGMMHLFEGVALCIRNPGGHTFPEGPEQQAFEYISLISMLAYRVQDARRIRP